MHVVFSLQSSVLIGWWMGLMRGGGVEANKIAKRRWGRCGKGFPAVEPGGCERVRVLETTGLCDRAPCLRKRKAPRLLGTLGISRHRQPAGEHKGTARGRGPETDPPPKSLQNRLHSTFTEPARSAFPLQNRIPTRLFASRIESSSNQRQ